MPMRSLEYSQKISETSTLMSGKKLRSYNVPRRCQVASIEPPKMNDIRRLVRKGKMMEIHVKETVE